MSKVLLIILLSIGLMGNVFAKTSKLKRITTVKVDGAGKNFKVLVGFENGSLDSVKKPILGGNYIQFTFPNTFIKPTKQVFRVEGEMVKKVLVYQYNDYTTRLRVFMNKKKLNHRYFNNVVATKHSKNILSISYNPKAKNSIIAKNSKKIKKGGNILDAIMNQAKRAKTKNEKKIGEETLEDYFARKDQEKKGPKKAGTTSSAFAKMLYSLGLVILLVLAVAWLFKKFSNGSKIAVKSKMVEILSREYIGAKSYVAVAKVLDRYLLLGITNENITTLAELDSVPEELLNEPKVKTKKMVFPKLSVSKKKKKVKKQKEPVTGIFKKVLGDVTEKVVKVKDVEASFDEPTTKDQVSFDSMQRIGEETLKRRAMGIEKKGDIDEADEFARNFANMIKEKVKDLPEI